MNATYLNVLTHRHGGAHIYHPAVVPALAHKTPAITKPMPTFKFAEVK